MQAKCNDLEFPQIKVPVIMNESDYAAATHAYMYWVQSYIIEQSNETVFRAFIQLIKDIAVLQQTELDKRVVGMMVGNLLKHAKFRSISEQIFPLIGDKFSPFNEMIADANFCYAETADLVMREMRGGSFYKTFLPRASLEQTLGLNRKEDVLEGYKIAFENYSFWIFSFFKMLENTERNDLKRSLCVPFQTIVGKQSLTMSRILLCEMADRIEALSGLRIDCATKFNVLPQLILFPEARPSIDQYKEGLEMSLGAIVNVEISAFNSAVEAAAVFSSFGVLAMVVGEYSWSKQAYEIACQFANKAQLEKIQKDMRLLSEITPANES